MSASSNSLFEACFNGDVARVKILIESGADVDKATTDDGTTPLYTACSKGHVDIVKLLLEGGADVDKATTDD